MLFDIATEEMRHLEIIGSIVAMLNKGAKGQLAEGVEQEAELYRSLTAGGSDSHPTALWRVDRSMHLVLWNERGRSPHRE
jgi:Mn-containing catalase